jgi:hypothetical protein
LDNEHVTFRAGNDMMCGAPEEQVFDPGLTMFADHDEVGQELLCFGQNHRRGIAAFNGIRNPIRIDRGFMDQLPDLFLSGPLVLFAV